MDTHFEKLRKEADVYYHKAQRELRIFRNTGCLTDKTKSKIEDSYKEAKNLIEKADKENDKSDETLEKICSAIFRPFAIASVERIHVKNK